MPFHRDSPELHLRDVIDLDQDLADELLARRPASDRPLVLVARRIVLSGARIRDRDLVLVAETVEAGVDGDALMLTRSGTANPARRLTAGSVAPPVPPAGDDAGEAEPGPSLTVICHRVLSGNGRSSGQQGGKGMQGPKETRSICQMSPPGPNNPCFNITDPVAQAQQGPPGGRGLQGGRGGRGGTVTVSYVDGAPPTTADWHGTGGAGGAGGDGGEGGGGVGIGPCAEPGGPGPQGPPGDDGEPVEGTMIRLLSAAVWIERVRAVTVRDPGGADIEVSVADLWAEHRRRQGTRDRRRGVPDVRLPVAIAAAH